MHAPSSPVAFSLFGIDVRYYGITLALSMILALFVSYKIAKRYYKNTDPDFLFDLFPILILTGILGARLYYVALNLEFFWHFPQEIFMFKNGGLSIHGALLGGFLGGFAYCKFKKLPVLRYADILSYGIILGQALGRWGNFFNSEAFGAPTTLPLLYIAPRFRPIEYSCHSYFHPTFLYESILNVLIFCILFFVVRKFAENNYCKDGVIFFSYLLLYSLARIFVEQIRIDSALNISGIPIAQIVSVILIFVALTGLYYSQSSR